MQDSFILIESAEEEEEEVNNNNNYNNNKLLILSKYFKEDSLKNYFEFNSIELIEKERLKRNSSNSSSGSLLFIDELLSLIPINTSNYPSTSYSNLTQLILDLINSDNPFNYCIILYLLLSTQQQTQDITLVQQFIKEFSIPGDFVSSIIGMEKLDSSQWREGITALVDARITTPDFVDKILNVLSILPPIQERASLVLNYVRLSGLVLVEEEQVGIVLDALCDSSRPFGVTEAMKKQRLCQDLEVRERMLIRILSNCFGDNPIASPVPHHLQTLLSHPLDLFEDQLVTTFCLSPPSHLPPRQISLIADWRISKLVSETRSVEAIEFGRKISRKGLKIGGEGRVRLLRAVRETLTEVQKGEVDLESEIGDTVATTSSTSTNKNSSNTQLSESQLQNPVWQTRDPVPSTSNSLSQKPQYLTLPKATPIQPPTDISASSLPLSASPFLRREKPLVSSRDGSSLGGATKNISRALKEGKLISNTGATTSNNARLQLFPSFNTNTNTNNNISSDQSATSSIITTPMKFSRDYNQFSRDSPRDGSPLPISNNNNNTSTNTPNRPPTLSGFGSIRTQPLTQLSLHSPAPSPAPSTTNVLPPSSSSNNKILPSNLTNNNSMQDSPSSFSKRATLDPAIANTITAALEADSPSPKALKSKRGGTSSNLNPNSQATPSRTTTTTSSGNLKKRGTGTSSKVELLQKEGNGDGDGRGGESFNKKRAISEERELRPSGSIGVRNKIVPGGFPSTTADGQGEDEDEEEAEEERRRRKLSDRKKLKEKLIETSAPPSSSSSSGTTLIRRTTRASSIQPSTPRLVTKSTSSKKSDSISTTNSSTGGLDTPRRSSRLTTPARELMGMSMTMGEEGGGTGKKSGTGTPARRKK